MYDPTSAIALIGQVVYAITVEVVKVRKFKKKCLQLSGRTVVLFGVMSKNKDSLANQDTAAPLEAAIRNCLTFIIQCQEWNVGSVALEVIFRKKFPKLKAEMDEWIKFFSTETLVGFKLSAIAYL